MCGRGSLNGSRESHRLRVFAAVSLLVSCVAVAALHGQEPQLSILRNAAFADGLADWTVRPGSAKAEQVEADGTPAVHLIVPAADPVEWYSVSQDHDARPGEVYELRVRARGANVQGGHGVYVALCFLRADGSRVSCSNGPFVHREGEWCDLLSRAAVPEGATRIRLSLLLHGTGAAWFADPRLAKIADPVLPPADGPVVLTVLDETPCKEIIGFGAEDDGWAYNPENAEYGVNEADHALREARIRWMDPDWVRMFFWYKDWYPSADTGTPGYTFDSPNMLSHYRTLDLYQEIGAAVTVVGVEWGFQQDPPDWHKFARAIGDLMEHLVVTKGYTCIKYWTLTNEPNISARFSDFALYASLHHMVGEEFKRRGLDIRIMGSDDTSGLPFFAQCVRDDAYFERADLFASHCYTRAPDPRMFGLFVRDRIDLLAARTPRKPFVVAEYGFHDVRTRAGNVNPVMEDYDYALWLTEFNIQALTEGASGLSVWCLHEVDYPGHNRMNYGLWNAKDRDWAVRPVYHAASMFLRRTETGDRVRRCRSSHPDHVRAVCVGDTLFWVNPSDRHLTVRLEGTDARSVRVMTESTLEGERETGGVVPLAKGSFLAPARSFGHTE